MAEWFRALDFNVMTRAQIPLWSLAGVVPGSLWFNSSVIPVNSQLVCLPSVGILNSLFSLFHSEKPLRMKFSIYESIYLFIHSLVRSFIRSLVPSFNSFIPFIHNV